MKIIHKALKRKEFQDKPPVLIDIGASGSIHSRWKKIAPYSICLTFDPDARDYNYFKREQKHYKQLHTLRCGVGNQDRPERTFYLTRSPYCSSFLKPSIEKLKPYSFSEKFIVEHEVKYEMRSIKSILSELNISYIDWFKSDSQGMDLQIFKSSGEEIIEKVIAAEFEPGIMDAYEGEDKLHEVLSFMEKKHFFLSELNVKGPIRIPHEYLQEITHISFLRKLIEASHKKIAGWGEMLYLNTFETDALENTRDYILGIVIAMLNHEYGFALELARKAKKEFKDDILNEFEYLSVLKIKNTILRLKFMESVWNKFLHK
ncbi:FkbM family methyltransferase [Thermoflavifilum thermophilum]|uniref:Methyltransferase, FkbM family n=1 Tax=Thermoflavifilum thermophilum TaxID=1393122 RepID=A0A1I7MYK2_9BACT|nr:FkbM family methyltransferase [Thermoflavifilum thermophilum]SFV27487.1 methyltransferase, FkbM family [Thermoflavifilum thermophilum]